MPRQKFTTTLDQELLEKIKIRAVIEKTSVSVLLERLIAEYLNQVESDNRE